MADTTKPQARQLRAGVPFVMCLPDGRSVFVQVPDHLISRRRGEKVTFTAEGDRFLEQIQGEALQAPKRPSVLQIRELRRATGLKQPEFAERIGYSVVTVKKWEAGELKPGKKAILRLHRLANTLQRRAARSA
jgi:DNA-binding transcriptional regulator YiaG